MARESRPTTTAAAKTSAAVETSVEGEGALIRVSGLVDERFTGFGDLGGATSAVINVSEMTRMTSFGVRQWLKAMDTLTKSITDLYLFGCPTFFVDQLNMVLNFGGPAKVLTVMAPYTCTSCGVESGEMVDVLTENANLAKGALPEKECARCGGRLEFDETPESYFAFVGKYAATTVAPAVAQMLAVEGLYTVASEAAEKPLRTIKLVHGSVTYFRISGTIGASFRARPFLVGAEGEVVLDLAEIERFDTAGNREWRRLLKSLAGQVPVLTLVDIGEDLVAQAADSLTSAENIIVASLLARYRCKDCQRESKVSVPIATDLADSGCTVCGGVMVSEVSPQNLALLAKVNSDVPMASAKVIANRSEILSRALTDATVAQAGADAPSLSGEDAILGKYKIVRRLSEGGMAEVFLAKQVGIGGFEKPVALKRIQRKLLEQRQLAIELFLNEAKIAGRLTHPNIVQVLDVGQVQGSLYLAMEYVHGRDLRELLKELKRLNRPMPLVAACFIAREVAQALSHAYWSLDIDRNQLSVVHRDVSPHNVMLGYDGTVKLLDFGVAMSSVTERVDGISGKWQYMSPEATNNSPLDHRSDLFSLGVVLYLLASGNVPFPGKSPQEIAKKIRAGKFKPLHEVAQVPMSLSNLVSRMLATNPEERPARGQEVVSELNEIARQNGLDYANSNMATFLAGVLPPDGEATTSRRASTTTGMPMQGSPRMTGNVPAVKQAVPTPAASAVPSSAAPGSRLGLYIGIAVVVIALVMYLVLKPA